MGTREHFLAAIGVALAVCFVVSYDTNSITSAKYETPFTFKVADAFDEIMDKMSSVNAENCKSKDEKDLVLPEGSVSQIPKYNELHKHIFFHNRSSLVHMLNMALNRAFFYSYIFQAQNASEADFKNNPGLMYYFMSSVADVTANPGFINGSSIYFDNDCHYPNWLNNVKFNFTIPLFGPSSWRADDYNEPTNRNREPTNNTVDVHDFGSGSDSNYTHPLYKPNLWYNKWMPDTSSAKDTLRKFTRAIGIQASNRTGILKKKTDTPFFGPPEPKESDIKDTLPVVFTEPYFDCGRSNRWVISATSPVVDYLARYVTNVTIVRRPRIVAVIVMDTEFEKLDINQCDLGEGHVGPNLFAGTHRCKKTTTCEPLFEFGFRRGGYQCGCKKGYRLPYWQDGPFLGVEMEESTEEEWNEGFDCLRIYENRIIPQVKPVIIGRQDVKKTAVIVSVFDERIKRSVKPSFIETVMSPFSGDRAKRSTGDGPKVTLVSRSKRLTGSQPKVKLVSKTRKKRSEPKVKLASRNHREKRAEPKVKLVSRTKRSFDQRKLERNQKNFDREAYMRMMRLRRRMLGVSGKNCESTSPQYLLLPGDVSYGVEVMLEPQARVALRLAHFLSNYLQNVVENERYGVINGDRLLHESQLWGEVMANVMADRKIKGSGVFFDRYKYRMSTPFNNSNPRLAEGIWREFFGPYAYREYQERDSDKESTLDKYNVIDMAGLPESERYISKRWFMDMKSRWATNFYHLKKYTMRPMVRHDKNGKSRVRFEYYPITYRAPMYEDGVWLRPTFKCDNRVMDWVVTYVVPFFGTNDLRTRLDFKGVVTVDAKLTELDMNQCPDEFNVANAFKGTARCDFETTYCVPMRGERFRMGSYKCVCKQGYEMPFIQFTFYDGATMEKEYALYVKGNASRFETLKCRIAGGSQTRISAMLLLAVALFSFILHL